ncbi:MAG TPA: aminotransferase class I/II-fold pyridoxal phosphate-dependent enzyme [Mycobacteriales bacterium]|nr:aminotransferase class I/II-fold pyridoxal phosphate-dependent enzyme [Mycobacteriales bacterium]
MSDRIGAIAESATLAVDAKAKALKAAGRPVIGFGAGEPDFPTPAPIVEAAAAACADPRNHRYTPAAGLPELREAVAAKTARDSGLTVAASQVPKAASPRKPLTERSTRTNTSCVTSAASSLSRTSRYASA